MTEKVIIAFARDALGFKVKVFIRNNTTKKTFNCRLYKKMMGKKTLSTLLPGIPPPAWRAAQPAPQSDVCQSSQVTAQQTSAGLSHTQALQRRKRKQLQYVFPKLQNYTI